MGGGGLHVERGATAGKAGRLVVPDHAEIAACWNGPDVLAVGGVLGCVDGICIRVGSLLRPSLLPHSHAQECNKEMAEGAGARGGVPAMRR